MKFKVGDLVSFTEQLISEGHGYYHDVIKITHTYYSAEKEGVTIHAGCSVTDNFSYGNLYENELVLSTPEQIANSIARKMTIRSVG